MAGHDFVDQRLYLIGVADIRVDKLGFSSRFTNHSNGRSATLLVDISASDDCPFAREFEGGRPTDPATASRDQSNFSVKHIGR
jgi:hypothetical protein